MKIDLLVFVFELDTVAIAGSCLWSLASYVGLASLREWVTRQLARWFNFAERWLYTSMEEYQESRAARESQNDFYASVLSIFPFLIIGAVLNWLVAISFGGSSWAVSLGLISCAICGVFALGSRERGEL